MNWEGRRWKVAEGIAQLARQLNAQNGMPHGADGTVASRTHDMNNPSSDHRPYPYQTTGVAVVRAIDVGDVDVERLRRITEALRLTRDPRVRYVIHDRRYYSPRTGWEWRTYTGSNPHATHIHISVTAAADSDGREWVITLPDQEEEYVSVKKGDRGPHVTRFQVWLKQLNALDDEADGIFGANTEAAVKKVQGRPEVALEPTGVIDLTTAVAIVERLADLRAVKHEKAPHNTLKDHKHVAGGVDVVD